VERKGYEMLKGIFELDKDWNEYSQEEQKEIGNLFFYYLLIDNCLCI